MAVRSQPEPRPASSRPSTRAGEAAVRELLALLGENPEREGLAATPRRVVESLGQLTSGYHADLDDIVAGAVFEEAYDEMVLVREIAFYSLCEHHLLPFYGQAHVAYVPDGRVLGLSKLPRIVDAFARRLQVQERLTTEIATAIDSRLHPKGVAVVLEADHLCMMMRGVEKSGCRTITSSMTGVFRRDPRTRAEFLGLIGHRS
ncbi:MAG: GTP cyclohydrolase I FolE [Candidatus Dormibacteraeota bacterium]|nr:GTP cyclohydrolase I FolE [Candidatus Dormibacteraeota bacterium]